MITELSPERLRWVCDPASLGFQTTEGLPPLEGLTGQERAVRALELGLGMRHKGFNVYVAGAPGTGKTTAVTDFLAELAKERPTPPDCCYVNNFADPYRPQVLQMPAGRGRELRRDMEALVHRVRTELPRAFESDLYAERREAIARGVQAQREEFLSQLNQRAQAEGFAVQASPAGLFVVPLREGRPITDQEFLSLDPPIREALREKREALEGEMKGALKQLQGIERVAQERFTGLNQQVTRFVVGMAMEDLFEKYGDLSTVTGYLQAVQGDMVIHLDQFLPSQRPGQAEEAHLPPWAEERPFRKYEVNLLVDNAETGGLPVVVELNPTYNNLVGRLEKEALYGALQTDFTLIRGGALHRANGGYLVVPVEDLLRNVLVYDSLKLVLRSKEIVVEEPGERLGITTGKTLQPQPVPLDAKVVLIGSPMVYQLLYQSDPDFRELFKIKADFDTRMDRTEDAVRDYVGFVCALAQKEGLRPMEGAAVARLIEQGARLAEDQEKLTTRFSEVADVVREADHLAALAGARFITREHVQGALKERVYRSNLLEERVQEMLRRGTLVVDTSGEAVGQVNGLSVLSMGDYAFGRPSRITVTLGLGQAGLIDIEREARLGGAIHTKGVLILSGYLSQQYSQDKPLSLTARLVFEQSYEGVDGDSASSAELYTLLSALSGVPIKQSLAVTGSVDQHGRVQAIGGANEKIEGFFALCRARGLVEGQGVLIPAANVPHLMLREEVVEAVREGRFHVYPVHTIDEGVEILTGVPAGKRGEDGRYPEGTVNARVDRKLRQMAEAFRAFGSEKKEQAKPTDREAVSPSTTTDAR